MHRERESLTWAEFRDVLSGLMQTDSRLWRHFTRDNEQEADSDV